MKVLVCGGRDFTDATTMSRVLGSLHLQSFDTIIQGGAAGADRLAAQWAEKNCVSCHTFWAQWKRYGSRAGPIRNGYMLGHGEPDLVIAFPGGRGTNDMMRRALRYNVPLSCVVDAENPAFPVSDEHHRYVFVPHPQSVACPKIEKRKADAWLPSRTPGRRTAPV